MTGGPANDTAENILATRNYYRQRDAERALDAMTAREMRLFREAAVMGFVRGKQSGVCSNPIPSDSDITLLVMESCRGLPDLYPTVAQL